MNQHRKLRAAGGIWYAAGWLMGFVLASVLVAIPFVWTWLWPILAPALLMFVLRCADSCGREAAGRRSPREEAAGFRRLMLEEQARAGRAEAELAWMTRDRDQEIARRLAASVDADFYRRRVAELERRGYDPDATAVLDAIRGDSDLTAVMPAQRQEVAP